MSERDVKIPDGYGGQIPWGLETTQLAPSSLQSLSEDNIKNLTTGVQKKSSFQKYKEQIEAKKKKAEDEAAKVYAEIFESFDTENASSEKQSKTFVRGETILNSTVISSAPQAKEYRLEAKGSTRSSKSYQTDTTHDEIKPEKKDKKRLLAELGEELAKYGLSFNAYNPRGQDRDAGKKFRSNTAKQSYDSKTQSNASPLSSLPMNLPQQIVVVPPQDPEVHSVINRLAKQVAKEGILFERMITDREKSSAKFKFLFSTSESTAQSDYNYYCWRIFSYLQGDSDTEWNMAPFRMYHGGPLWYPPPLDSKNDFVTKTAGSKRLPDDLREQLEEILRNITLERSSIRDAMAFALDHADMAAAITQVITESLTLPETQIHTKLARLFVISDILYNSSAPVPNASAYRTCFESKLEQIFRSFQETYRGISGRMTSENLKVIYYSDHHNTPKEQVLKVLRIWGSWSVYQDRLLQSLISMFVVSQPDDDIDGVPI